MGTHPRWSLVIVSLSHTQNAFLNCLNVREGKYEGEREFPTLFDWYRNLDLIHRPLHVDHLIPKYPTVSIYEIPLRYKRLP